MKKAVAIFTVMILILSLITAFAEEEHGVIQNVKITKSGILTWDEYGGSSNYWLGVEHGFTPFSNGSSVTDRINSPGDYLTELELEAEDGSKMIANAVFYIRYDGKEFCIIEENEVTTSAAASTSKGTTGAPVPQGLEISVSLTAEGILSWSIGSDYNAEYWLGVNGDFLPAESGCSLLDRITDPGDYMLTIDVYTTDGSDKILSTNIDVVYDGKGFSASGPAVPSSSEESDNTTVLETGGTNSTAGQSDSRLPASSSENGAVKSSSASAGNGSSSSTVLYIAAAFVAGVFIATAAFFVIKKSKK